MTVSPAFRRLVELTFVAAFLAAAWGGVVRVSGSGLGCPDWPLCHGTFLPQFDAPTFIEWFHRLIAIVSGLTLAATALWTLVRYRGRNQVCVLVFIAVPLYWLQAILGAVTVLLELPHTWITAHLANAELLLAALTVLVVLLRRPGALGDAAGRPVASWSWLPPAAAVATFVLMLSGAYVRGADATTACGTWPFCESGLLPAADAPLIHMLHRYVAALGGIVILAAAVAGWRHRREIPGVGAASALVGALFAIQVVAGAANPLTGFSPWALGLHPAIASALWCATVALAVLAWRPPSQVVVGDYVALTKPSVMSLLLLTAVGGMFLAARGVPPFHLLAATLVGGAAASGGAASLNHYLDRDIDRFMRRTSARPIVTHRIPGAHAVVLGVVLNVVAFAVLALVANVLAASLALAGTLFYIFVYTLWLKRTTVQNIVIGGAAGAVPPLVGWAAVNGSLDLAAWLVFAIIFAWTPAHFWALALLIKDDYARAGVPMLPVVRGERETSWGILRYALALVPLSALLFLTGAVGVLYLVASLVLGGVFVAYAVRLLRSEEVRRRAAARATYLYSLLYLALLFVAMMLDSTILGRRG